MIHEQEVMCVFESSPVVRPEAYRDRTAWMATYMAGQLKVSNMI